MSSKEKKRSFVTADNASSKTTTDIDAKVQSEIDKDLAKIQAGDLKSPSTDYQFIWDKKTGERYLFKGKAD